jgi:hypothetical protein
MDCPQYLGELHNRQIILCSREDLVTAHVNGVLRSVGENIVWTLCWAVGIIVVKIALPGDAASSYFGGWSVAQVH